MATVITNYRPGDIIEQHCFGQPERSRMIVVDQRYGDIKNGRPGFEGHEAGTGMGVWGYDTDVFRIVARREDTIHSNVRLADISRRLA